MVDEVTSRQTPGWAACLLVVGHSGRESMASGLVGGADGPRVSHQRCEVTDHFLAVDAVTRYSGAPAEGLVLDCGQVSEAVQGAEDRLELADQLSELVAERRPGCSLLGCHVGALRQLLAISVGVANGVGLAGGDGAVVDVEEEGQTGLERAWALL